MRGLLGHFFRSVNLRKSRARGEDRHLRFVACGLTTGAVSLWRSVAKKFPCLTRETRQMGNPPSNYDDQAGSGRCQSWRYFKDVLLLVLIMVVFMRIFRSPRGAEIDRRARGQIPCKALQDRLRSGNFQLPSIIAVAFGLGLCACSLWIRVPDSKYPQVSEYALGDQRVGVYLDLTSRVALLLTPEKNVLRSDLPEDTWTMKLEPGKKYAQLSSMCY
jgi:hypothetical protein